MTIIYYLRYCYARGYGTTLYAAIHIILLYLFSINIVNAMKHDCLIIHCLSEALKLSAHLKQVTGTAGKICIGVYSLMQGCSSLLKLKSVQPNMFGSRIFSFHFSTFSLSYSPACVFRKYPNSAFHILKIIK